MKTKLLKQDKRAIEHLIVLAQSASLVTKRGSRAIEQAAVNAARQIGVKYTRNPPVE